MPHIFAVANTKGGVGKSTLAVNLAILAATQGKKVLLVDADPQGSGLQFLGVRGDDRPEFQGVQITQPIIHKQLPELAERFDYVLIDVGGRDAPVFRSALVAADTILIPMVPSVFDAWASEDVFNVLSELSASQDIDARVILNQTTPTVIAREALQSLHGDMKEQGVTILRAEIQNRTAWPRAIGEGLGVAEWEPHGKAAAELYELGKELGIYEYEKTAEGPEAA
ncbi:MAG TPA: AAA family ATPase [Acidobacteriota bacterium]|nr:AAA family ATPase [Acidobacteriota bacterium]